MKSSPPPQSEDAAGILWNLGKLKRENGDREEAFRLTERACGSAQKESPPVHKEMTDCLVNLAGLLADRGDLKQAEKLYERVLSIQTALVGPEGWNQAPALAGYASLHLKSGRPTPALDCALHAEAIARAQFQETARVLTEHQALRYDEVRESGLDVALSVLASSPPSTLPTDAIAQVWDAVVKSRALVLDEMASRHRSLLETRFPEIEAPFAELDAVHNRMARLAESAPGEDEIEKHRAQLLEAQREKERLQDVLAEKSPEFRRRMAARGVGLAEVLASLPADGALVAYVQYGRPSGVGRRASAPASYAALVAVAGRSRPDFIRIGDARNVDSLISRWRRVVSSPPPPTFRSASLNPSDRDHETGNELRQLLWDVLPEEVRTARRVFIVPDGNVHLVNFGALPDARSSHLIDSGPLLHYLSTERDLEKTHPTTKEGGFLVMGAPHFGDSTMPASCPGRKRPAAHAAFEPIPASFDEAKEIAELLAGRFAASSSAATGGFLTGREATEEAFKRLAPGQRVIHLATHTFVADGDAANPLRVSGLAFAGANDRMCDEADSGEDGILTAEEIASEDLSAAEWVVLSACDTGLGAIQAGEGVLGLRRAFEIAGARTLVMSLWDTDDEAAREWMAAMYRSRLNGAPWPEALREATHSLIADRKKAGLSVDPYYWGAFVAAGDWK